MGETVRALFHVAAIAAMIGLFVTDRFGASIAAGLALLVLGYVAGWLIERRKP